MSTVNDHVAVDWRYNDGGHRRRLAWVGTDPDEMFNGRRLAKAVFMADFPSSSAPLSVESQRQKWKKVFFFFLMDPSVISINEYNINACTCIYM
jgi:hypothetical protein